MDLEEEQEEEVRAAAKVLEGPGEVGLDVEVRLGLRKTAFVPIVEQLFHTGGDYPVFRQNVPIVAHL